MAKDTAAGFDFLVESLKANKGATYADLRAKAEQKGLTVYPVMFGRAKAMLGLVKSSKRGSGKAAKKAAARRSTGGRGGRSGSKSERIRELLRTGMSASEIAKQVGCSVNLVYNVKAQGGGARRPGRPPGRGKGVRKARSVAASRASGVQGLVATLQEQAREHERLVRALGRIREILDEIA